MEHGHNNGSEKSRAGQMGIFYHGNKLILCTNESGTVFGEGGWLVSLKLSDTIEGRRYFVAMESDS